MAVKTVSFTNSGGGDNTKLTGFTVLVTTLTVGD